MNGIGVVTFLQTRLKTIAALGNRVYLGQSTFDPGQTLPLATVIGIETEIERQDCNTHHVVDTLVIEGQFAAAAEDVLTPGHALLASFQSAIKAADCDYTYGGQFIDLTFSGRRVIPREDGSSIGVCQLKLAVRYHEDF
jgi:hypothetical protein